MRIFGLLGRHLQHSYSPKIHAGLYPYDYRLFEKEPEDVETFLKTGKWDGLNVTIPYKKTAYSLTDVLGEDARRTGSVNTLIRLPDGRLYGESTDVYGFRAMVKHSGIPVEGKKVLVLGAGGAALAVTAALQDLLAEEIVIVSRRPENARESFSCLLKGENTEERKPEPVFCGYGGLSEHLDADVLVNATPVGMFPENGASPADLRMFADLKGVFDLIYNPCRTALLLQAEELRIPFENGLYMLVAQAKKSAEIFTEEALDDMLIGRIYDELLTEMQNIALIGMPGVGKTTEGKKIAAAEGRDFCDTDEEIEKRFGRTPSDIIRTQGEEAFRQMETEVLRDVSKRSHAVIATGGGIVTRPENYPLLHQNSTILWLKRDVNVLPTDGRPLSQAGQLEKLYEARKPLYKAFADEIRDLDRPAAGTGEERTNK